MRQTGNVSHMGQSRGAYRVLVGKSEGKRPLKRARLRWKDNIKMNLKEMGWGIDCICLARDGDR